VAGKSAEAVMYCEWNALPEDLQLTLAREALHRAASSIAVQAEILAEEMESGNLADHGGADALRLFAALVRSGACDVAGSAGHA
jgi:hypothetical protein